MWLQPEWSVNTGLSTPNKVEMSMINMKLGKVVEYVYDTIKVQVYGRWS